MHLCLDEWYSNCKRVHCTIQLLLLFLVLVLVLVLEQVLVLATHLEDMLYIYLKKKLNLKYTKRVFELL